MDTIVYKNRRQTETETLSVKTHIKPTNKQLYVTADSFHPKGTLKSVVIGETHRYRTTNTEEQNFNQMVSRHIAKLQERGYPPHLTNLHKQVKFSERKTNPPSPTQSTPTPTTIRLTTKLDIQQKLINTVIQKHWNKFQWHTRHNSTPLPTRITMCYKRNNSARHEIAKTRIVTDLLP